MTCTPDGRWVFSAEGGKVAFLDVYDEQTQAYTDQDLTTINGTKKVPLGEFGVLASKLLLDPEAAAVPTGDDLLYVAAGRDGLWIFQADVDSGVENRAWRVDDSGNGDPSSQGGHRWCTDVAVMTVEGVDYLLATYAKKGESRLRVYELQKVRDIGVLANSEVGHEIGFDHQVMLNNNPVATERTFKYPAKNFGGAVAMSIAVDQDGAAGSETADVYVAMGHHGLAKIHFWSSGGVLKKTRTWGPMFGSGPGAMQIPPPAPGMSQALYDNLIQEDVRSFHVGNPVIRREEFPFFTDVEVLDEMVGGQRAHHLYVAVDHLHWMVFDLEQAWGPSQPILAHIGDEDSLTKQYANETIRFVGENPNRANCARSLSVAHDPQGGTFVVVSSAWKTILRDYVATDYDGTAYDSQLGWGGGEATEPPCKPETWVYEVVWNGGAAQFEWPDRNWMTAGGEGVCAPPQQELLVSEDRLKMIYRLDVDQGNGIDRGLGVALFDLDPGNGLPSEFFNRDKSYIVGTYGVTVGTIPEYPDIVLTGHNDGGVPAIGPFRMEYDPSAVKWDMVSLYSPPAGSTADERGPQGLLWRHPGSQSIVVDEVVNGEPELVTHAYVTSGGTNYANTSVQEGQRWVYQKFGGFENGAAALNQVMWRYLIPDDDRFSNPGRVYYQDLDLFRELSDAGATNQPMAGNHMRTPEGLTWIWRTELDLATADTENGDDLQIGVDPFILSVKRLVTHPEFNWMPADNPIAQAWWLDDPTNDDDVGNVRTFNSIAVEVQKEGVWGHYVLAVPCGTIMSNPDWAIFRTPQNGGIGDDNWLPDPIDGQILRDNYGHGLVQFWEIEIDAVTGDFEPAVTTEGPPGDVVPRNTTLSRIIVPNGPQAGDPLSAVLYLDQVRIGDEVYLIVPDFGGTIYAYDITDILAATDPKVDLGGTAIGSWTAPLTTFDDLPTSIFDVAVDHGGGETAIIYVGARRGGVHALRFDPNDVTGVGEPFQSLGHMQTPADASGLHLQTSSYGTRQLLVSDYGGGLRLYGPGGGQ
ncbi:MAG: hypothetical protein O3A47_10400 [Chloroflexi bacterium]|nr:hypothetical protein [Chloroflexota bacterium]